MMLQHAKKLEIKQKLDYLLSNIFSDAVFADTDEYIYEYFDLISSEQILKMFITDKSNSFDFELANYTKNQELCDDLLHVLNVICKELKIPAINDLFDIKNLVHLLDDIGFFFSELDFCTREFIGLDNYNSVADYYKHIFTRLYNEFKQSYNDNNQMSDKKSLKKFQCEIENLRNFLKQFSNARFIEFFDYKFITENCQKKYILTGSNIHFFKLAIKRITPELFNELNHTPTNSEIFIQHMNNFVGYYQDSSIQNSNNRNYMPLKVFRLYVFKEKSYDEIKEILDIQQATLESHITVLNDTLNEYFIFDKTVSTRFQSRIRWMRNHPDQIKTYA